MVAIIEFELSAENFALEETLRALPGVHIEIERVVADDPTRITPYVWVQTDDFDALEAAFEKDPTVESMTLLSETDEERSYQMVWTGSVDLIIRLLTDHEGTIITATGSDEKWHLRAVFPDRKSLSQAHDSAKNVGLQFDVQSIYGTDDTRHVKYGLTEKQRDTIVAAFEAGYFEVPRDVSLSEFAAQQNLSHQAISEQLRRATSHLVESTLISDRNTNGG
ncbi:bacterio-opsin activator domain-containing protein [Halalkalicoccus sp. NIPERK01]|uniref:bacterio-opsin activator domain-containing protein n=1 Tax=Halalkalicoccus sp. NIPERK01 TaxID=3053469 RepID=UPI00256EA276|nr:bacterio-opsin activator domain-containing protein [Halalkalicoccus sp. NIPERK01]MDL5363084.1 helix-turn-helix domain-containing protein [Halalkalicoccus sp. NIPERK01]